MSKLRIRRPIVLISLFSLIEIFLLVLNIELLPIILVLSVLSGIIFAFIFFREEKLLAIICTVMLIIPVINAGYSYYKRLLPAKNLAKDFGKETDTVYTADIYDHTSFGNYSTSFAKITHVGSKRLEKPVKSRIVCYGATYLRENSSVVFKGVPTFISDIEKDDFDTQFYLFGKGVFLDFDKVEIISAAKSENTDIFSSLRYKTKSILYKYFPYKTEGNVSVAYAMFTGDSSLISKSTKSDFSKSGTLHVLCVSGMHLVVLCSFLSAFLKGLTLSKPVRCLIIMAFCILYTSFTGFSLSTLRACIMCIITYIGLILGKRSDAYISLFLSAYIITSIDPFSLFDISLILSFTATLGLMVVSSMVPKLKHRGFFNSLATDIAAALLCGVGAICFTLPFCAFFFGEMSLYSIVSTLIISLPSEILLSLLFGLILLSPISFFSFGDTILSFLGYICSCLSGFTITIAEFFAKLKFASISSVFGELFLIIFLSMFLLLSPAIAFKRRGVICIIASLLILSSAMQIGISLYFNIREDALYKVFYYRKNEEDRQLSIKLGPSGYLLVNADNKLCTNPSLCPFDSYNKCNYLLIIPDDIIDAKSLSRSIKSFYADFGIKKIYVPETADGADLFLELTACGIKCDFFPMNFTFDNIRIDGHFDGFNSLLIDDGKVCTNIVYANKYDEAYFEEFSDKCMFLTRKTKNQFDTSCNIPPNCSEFYARLKKGEVYENTINLFGIKSIEIER